MPKPDEALQKELGTPKSFKVTPIKQDYPEIIVTVSHGKGVTNKISPVTDKKLREEYNPAYEGEQNLHDQFVKPNAI